MTIDEMRSFLGKRVKLTYAYDAPAGFATICVGILLGFGDGGDFEILEDDGFVHYGWPLLEMEEAESEDQWRPM